MAKIITNQKSDRQVDVPKEIKNKIKRAWIAGLISIGISVVFTLISISGTDILGLDAWAFVDVLLGLVLVFGIYKKSRTCALLLLLLFSANKVIMWLEAGTASGIPLALVFLWFYIQGVIGTFQYHHLIKKHV